MEEGLSSSPTPFTPPTTEDGRLSWLRLIRSRRVGPATFRRLMAEHGSAEAALDALPAVARAAGAADYAPCPAGVAAAELAQGRKAGARLVFLGAADYPPDLADLPDAPPVLWVLGDPAMLLRPMVALVGARNASSAGLRMARRLAADLAQQGIAVVSGLARGIDAAAHEGALARGTLAVHAGGVDVVYPAENADLAARIAAQGARLSEMPPGVEPQARHFPARNRIVSGLALGTVVVEAAEGSGSLITARTAADQGREVMAVPGHPVDPRAAGCNALIRDGATLVRSAADVVEALGPALAAAQAARAARPAPAEPAAGTPAPPARLGRLTAAALAAIRGAPSPASARTAAAVQARMAAPDAAAPGAAARSAAAPAGARPAATAACAADPLHAAILDRLGAAPLAEDQLIRDLALPAARVAAELLALELEGRVERRPGGLLARAG